MGVFYHVFSHHLRQVLQYRGALLLSLFLHPLIMVFHTLMFKGIYEYNHQQTLLGYTLPQMIWYFGSIHFFYYLVWNNIDKSINEKVLYGGFEVQLLKPFSIMAWEFSQLASQKILSVIIEFVPVYLIYYFICFPDFMSVTGLCQYLILSVLALIQFFLMGFTMGVLSFKLNNLTFLNSIKFIIVNIFAGAAFPIEFFPEILKKIILVLPFHYLYYTPVQFLLGRVNIGVWKVFAECVMLQMLWILAFFIIARSVLNRTMKSYMSVGG